MQDTLLSGDVITPCATVGGASETFVVSRPRHDFRAIAAFGGVASLAVAVIGAGDSDQAAGRVGGAEFRAADRSALRHLSYRLS